ncbi:putative serine/threonine-protein phosphatase C26H8.05c [Dictyocoela muelleri]|nr:putative serine/threonine-protein phosphatase C26H8.05c [Dictyocoela muelleri]
MFDLYEEKLIRGDRLSEMEVEHICMKASEILINEPNIPSVSSPVIVCGDIHGQFYDLLNIFELNGRPGKNNDPSKEYNFSKPKEKRPKKRTYDKNIKVEQCDIDKNFNDGLPKTYIFLGDYVDRGLHGVETMSLLLIYKIMYPEHIYLVRGNHESRELNKSYGFYEEIRLKYGNTAVWRLISDVYNFLNVGVLINGRILAVHGGISPNATSINQIQRVDRFQNTITADLPCNIPSPVSKSESSFDFNVTFSSFFGFTPFYSSPKKNSTTKDYFTSKEGYYSNKQSKMILSSNDDYYFGSDGSYTNSSSDMKPLVNKIHEFDKKIHSDILWSDPSPEPGFKRNTRGLGVLYGNDVTNTFCELNDLIRIVRSHQLILDGYKIDFADNSCITVWSAPNYCYRCGNLASVMYVDDEMEINEDAFRVFSAVECQIPKNYNKFGMF